MKIELDNINWQEFVIGDIFKISTGNLISKEYLIKGDIPRITATDKNNGIFDFYKAIDNKNYREQSNFISVSFLGSVFYHPYKASLDMKIHAIKIPDFELNKYIASFIVICLKKTVSVFSYGDQLSSSDLPKKKILLPVNKSGMPDYEFMEKYTKQLELKKKKKFNQYISIKIGAIKGNKNIIPLNQKKWGEFLLKDIFPEIQRGRRLKKDDHKNGLRPYVSSSAFNNGIDGFISNKDNVRVFKNCITLANSGSVGASFYQPFAFIASDHITKLENIKFNEYIYLFIASITKRLGEKYGFNREINDTRIQREKILLPIDDYGKPDYLYMESYIKKIQFDKLKKYS